MDKNKLVTGGKGLYPVLGYEPWTGHSPPLTRLWPIRKILHRLLLQTTNYSVAELTIYIYHHRRSDALVLMQDQKSIQLMMKLQAFLMTSGSGLWSYSSFQCQHKHIFRVCQKLWRPLTDSNLFHNRPQVTTLLKEIKNYLNRLFKLEPLGNENVIGGTWHE
jgi:hypothetical protein